MSLPSINDFFEKRETLRKVLPSYEIRESQIQMAKAIRRVVMKGGVLFVEAATGIGKTLAYLLPILTSGKRVVVSTATKTLQEQIAKKDIPLLEKLLGVTFDVLVLKGRQNYLCKRRLSRFMRQPLFSFAEETKLYEPFLEWTRHTRRGDREELKDFPENLAFWEEVNSRSDLCLGSKCPFFRECFVTKLKREAGRADLLIVNHHLFFSDLALRLRAPAEVLPPYDGVVFDEAHRVEGVATLYFGWQLSGGQFEELIRDIKQWKGNSNSDKLFEVLDELQRRSHRFFASFPSEEERFRVVVSGLPSRVKEEGRMILENLTQVEQNLRRGERRDLPDAQAEIEMFTRRIRAFKEGLQTFLDSTNPSYVVWGERKKRGILLHISPIEIGPILGETFFNETPFAVFTSATLSVGGDFRFIRERVGAPASSSTLILSSPFDYENRVRIFIPKTFPLPGTKEYEDRLPGLMKNLIALNRGRALLLFTSYRQMNRVYGLLHRQLSYPLFLQGELPKTELLKKFREEASSVLFATASFWEGIDVPGDALTAVVIDKLPFFVPDDPLESARMEEMKRKGKNPFFQYQVPTAVIALKQGIGRLMRHKNDRGILAICDSRIYRRSYGKLFLKSLPPAKVVHSLRDLEAFVEEAV